MPKFTIDKNLLKVIIVAVIISLVYFFFSSRIPFLTSFSLKTADLFSRLTYQIRPKPEEIKEIVCIVVDDNTFVSLKKKWPWPRSVIADFLNQLKKYQPKVISLDIAFIGASENKNNDLQLAKALKDAGNVILSAYIGPDGSYNKPFKPLHSSALDFGFINKPRDKDLIVRSSRLLFPKKKGSRIYDMCFALKSILHYLDIDKKALRLKKDKLLIDSIKKRIIPVTQKGTVSLNFQAKEKDFRVIPFHKIIKETVPKELIAGKLVVVGVTAEIFHDIYHTPLSLMPGVILNANEILMYLSGKAIHQLPKSIEFLLILAAALICVILTYKLGALKGFIALLIQIAILTILSLLSCLHNLSFDYFGPLFMASFLYLGTQSFKYGRLLIEAAILKTLAITDGLTGLYVHRYLVLKLESEFNHAKEEDMELSFLIMDIDHFKKINDTYGHEQGNVILKNIAKIIQESSRRVDIVARYGGEEFCAILPGTNEKGASIYAQRVRKTIQEFDFPYKQSQPLKTTISIGIASRKQTNPQTYKELIEFADKALYEAKETGRNKVCFYVPPENPPDNQ